MKTTAITASVLTLAALMLAGAAHATAVRGEQNGVTYLNGGDSVPQVKRLERREHGYNLRLVFSEGRKNDYAADVHLKISDHHGKTVLDLAGAGPLTDVKLPDGTYRVDAHFGAMAQHDTVQISGGKPVDLYLHFPHDAAVS